MLSSKGSSQSRDRTHVSCVSCTAGGFFTTEPVGKPGGKDVLIQNPPRIWFCSFFFFFFWFFNIYLFIYLHIWLYQVLVVARGIFSGGMWNLVPWPGIEPRPPALGAWSLSLCTTREVPYFCFQLPPRPPLHSIIWIEKSLFKTFKQRIFIKVLPIMENWKQSKFQTIKDVFNFSLENGKRKAQSRK